MRLLTHKGDSFPQRNLSRPGDLPPRINKTGKVFQLPRPEIEAWPPWQDAESARFGVQFCQPGTAIQDGETTVTTATTSAIQEPEMTAAAPTGNLEITVCLLYTSDAADDLLCVD